MQALYENERVVVYVNRDLFMAYLDSWIESGRLGEGRKVEFERRQLVVMDSTEFSLRGLVYEFMIDKFGSGDLAVYDKLEESCITTLKKRRYSYDCGLEHAGSLTMIYLPDCTKLFEVWDWIS
jgi:hypothetical protein